jgi:hypothetical protein
MEIMPSQVVMSLHHQGLDPNGWEGPLPLQPLVHTQKAGAWCKEDIIG